MLNGKLTVPDEGTGWTCGNRKIRGKELHPPFLCEGRLGQEWPGLFVSGLKIPSELLAIVR
jgi:hypothetical protein